jgi:hypothetical protein
MIQNVIRDMGGIAIFGVISVCLFFSVFLGAAIFAFTRRKTLCAQISVLPLEDGSVDSKGGSHE